MNWFSTEDILPPIETPVLIVCQGKIRIGELLWERPGWEDTHKAYKYWDDPVDDGQCWEWYDITFWMPLPAPPDFKYNRQECEHKRTKWTIDFQSGHCQDCGCPLPIKDEK